MAKGMVVYDTYFGNTERVAQAIGAALADRVPMTVRKVSEATPADLQGLSLLVVGAPTRAFHASPAIGKWLSTLPRSALAGVAVAGFDTRMWMDDRKTPGILRFMAGIFGYAAEPIARKLVRAGGKQAAPPAGFYVTDTEGPLKAGELDRAAGWARQIADGL